MIRLWIVLVFALTLLIVGCKKEDEGGNISKTFQFPLQQGNKWEYHTMIDSSYPHIDWHTAWEVSGTEMINGKNNMVMDKTDDLGYHEKYYYTNEDNGFFLNGYSNAFAPIALKQMERLPLNLSKICGLPDFIQRPTLEDSLRLFNTPFQLIKYPVEIGDAWLSREYPTIPSYPVIRKFLRWESVTTPAGTFDCIVMEVDDGNFPAYLYLSEKGLIKQELILLVADQNQESFQEETLTSVLTAINF